MNVTYGQRIELHHIHTRSQRLHSHQINLKSGSYQQQVTCWEGHDLGDAWVVKPAHGVPLNSKQGQPVLYGDIIVLEHYNTRKNLHSHIMQSEVTKQQEVTCFGDNGIGDGNDNWRIIAEHDNQFNGSPVTFGSTIRFTHVPTNTHLHSHLANFGNHYGHTQQEVTAFAGSDGNDHWKIVPYDIPNPVVKYGDKVELHHIHTGSKRLHSHQINLKTGSYQQQVTCWEGHDLGDAWVVKPSHGVPLNSKQGQPVLYGDIIVLEHFNTRKNLHSHLMQSEVTQQQEVTCFGDNGIGDGNDNWRIIAEHDNQFNGSPVNFGSTIRFTHLPTNTHLHSHLANYGNHYGHTQQEVTAFAGSDGNDHWKFVPYN